jgi:hypothetical protein
MSAAVTLRSAVFTLVATAAGRVVGGGVILCIGVLTLAFNRRWTEVLVTGQREAVGTLLGPRRGVSDRIHTSRGFIVAARIFVAAISIAFIAGGIATMVTAGHRS